MTYTWDSDNKLRSADIDANGTADVNFQYDALGRRVARTGTGGSVVFVQMDQQTIADYPVGGAATTPTFRYVYASYIDEPVVRKGPTSTSTVHFYHRNHQYSVTAITTSTGAIAERYAYTAYGQPTILNASGTPLSPQTSTLNSRYSYTGREWDATLGLHHFRARWMSPVAGRFLGRDPIGYLEREYLLYLMLSSKALKGLDPSGHSTILAGCGLGAVGGAIGSAVSNITIILQGQYSKACCNIGCDAFGGCIAGAVTGAFPSMAGGCLGGVVGSLASSVCQSVVCGGEPVGTCTFINAFVSGVLGCLGGAAADADGDNLNTVLTLMGINASIYNSMCSGGGSGPSLGGGPVCCTFSSGIIWSETVNSNPGESPGAACRRRGSGWVRTWQVMGARGGACGS